MIHHAAAILLVSLSASVLIAACALWRFVRDQALLGWAELQQVEAEDEPKAIRLHCDFCGTEFIAEWRPGVTGATCPKCDNVTEIM